MLNTDQKSSLLYKHNLGVADTRTNRDFYEEAIKSSFCIQPNQLLMYGDQIPTADTQESVNLIKNLQDGEYYNWQKDETTVIHIVQYHEDYPLSKIDNGTDNSFKLVDDQGEPLKNIIPFNFSKDLYNYTLKTKNGQKIYFGVGDWVLDIYTGVLTFYGDVPSGVDHENPPTISFYQYVGGTGFRQDTFGYDGVIMPITNWHISKGRYLIDTEYKENDSSWITLDDKICESANKIQDNYVGVFGYDGNDKNEGVALTLEPIISLIYTENKDNVKGYDDSANAEVGTLLSRTTVNESELDDYLKVTFSSHNISLVKEHKITIQDNTISFDDGKFKSIKKNSTIKLPDSESNFIIVDTKDFEDFPNGEYTVSFKTCNTYGLLLYWNKVLQEYLPFVTNEDNYYNFGFPVVAANGRIPPSVTLGSILNSYSDSITPDYYGPRNYSVTVALEKGINVKSADYVVKNKFGYYLDDIFDEIVSDYTSNGELYFMGAIFLRAGEYKLSKDLDLTRFNTLNIIGEDLATTKITGGNIILGNDSEGMVTISNVDFNSNDITFNSESQKIILNKIICDEFTAEKKKNTLILKNSSFRSIDITGEIESTETNDIYNNILGNHINIISVKTGYTLYSANTIGRLILSDVTNDVVKSCFINTVEDKPHQTGIWESTVINYVNVPFTEIPRMKYFPIYSKESDNVLEYATFDNPFEINYDPDQGNFISLKIDDKFLYLLDDGRLSVHVDSSQISLDTSSLTRNENYEGLSPQEVNPEKTLEKAIKDIYLTKADLNPDGKIPLEELPDSVAYGGLLYVGPWSFEYKDTENGNAEENFYVDGGDCPTYEDCVKNLTADQTQEGIIQPGWFFIIESSKKNIDYPAADQKSKLLDKQGEPVVFTAGDWLICSGKKKSATYDKNFFENNQLYYGNIEGNDVFIKVTDGTLDFGLKENAEEYFNGDDTAEVTFIGKGTNLTVNDNLTISYDYEHLFDEYNTLGGSLQFISSNGNKVTFRLENNSEVEFTVVNEESIPYTYEYSWEKLDRAYQDVAYMILPVYTTGEHLCWSWRQSGESGNAWGKGALDLSKETIAESFDKVNQELRKLWVKHPAILSKIELKPFYDDYKTITYFPIVEGKIFVSQNTAFDLNKDSRIEDFRVKTPETEKETWKSSIFVGDNCTFNATVDGSTTVVNYTPSDELTSENVHISAAIDPYDIEYSGSGYWKSVYVDFASKNKISSGEHKYMLSMTNITPNNSFTQDALCSTDVYKMKSIEPYDYEKHTSDDVSKISESTVVVQHLNSLSEEGTCSGVQTIVKDKVSLSLTFSVTDAIDEFINKDRLVIRLRDIQHNIMVDVPESCINLIPSTDNIGLYHIQVKNFQYFFENDNLYDKISFDVFVYDVYGNNRCFKNQFEQKYLTSYGLNENERVKSGRGLNPTFNTNSSDKCGYPFNSKEPLTNEGNNELQKVARIFEDNVIFEYKWPYGSYPRGEQYSNITTGDTSVDPDKNYRFVTFNKFWNGESWEEVVLNEASGFVLDFDVEKDELHKWTYNEYSLESDDIIIQAKVVNPNTEDNQSITRWVDCNKPYDGFGVVGEEDNQSGMYAGSSTATKKRVTFGKDTYSGNLIIRVGIPKEHKLSFKHLSIKEII